VARSYLTPHVNCQPTSEGKVKIQNTVKTSGNREAKATTKAKGDRGGYRFVGVKSMKTLADSCR
jgi:hypothetical protein